MGGKRCLPVWGTPISPVSLHDKGGCIKKITFDTAFLGLNDYIHHSKLITLG